MMMMEESTNTARADMTPIEIGLRIGSLNGFNLAQLIIPSASQKQKLLAIFYMTILM
jgi:hypothetical protein